MRPHRWQPTRFLRPWDFPGKGTGVGCHCLLRCYQQTSAIFNLFQRFDSSSIVKAPSWPAHNQWPIRYKGPTCDLQKLWSANSSLELPGGWAKVSVETSQHLDIFLPKLASFRPFIFHSYQPQKYSWKKPPECSSATLPPTTASTQGIATIRCYFVTKHNGYNKSISLLRDWLIETIILVS